MVDRDRSRSSNRGFASMDQKKQREIASKGGRASGGNFKNDPERASEAGRKGGQSVAASERSFSRNHQLAAEAGRKGGEHSHSGAAMSTQRSGRTAGPERAISRQSTHADRPADRGFANGTAKAELLEQGESERGHDQDKDLE